MSIMNHECPHCFVNLERHGTRTRLVQVGQHKGLYPCCPYCRTVLDINLPPVAGGVGVSSVVLTAFVASQSVAVFESFGYAYQDAVLFSLLLAMVLSFGMVRAIRRMIPSHWSVWRKIARSPYHATPDIP
jgi:hypothetical protein